VSLTCVYCKARMETRVERKIDPMKFVGSSHQMLLCLPVVTLLLLPVCNWAYVHTHTCPDCGSFVGGA